MTQVQPDRAHPPRTRSSEPFTPGVPSNPAELAGFPETLAGPLPVPLADPQTREFVEEWRNASYNCFSSGHKFCREVCPVTQVERNESWTPTAFHANVIAMERGELDIADVAADYVNCTQCGACELRCPNTLFTGDFYRFRTRTVDVVKAVRALAVESGVHQPEWQVLERAHRPAHARAGARRDPGQPGARSATGPRASTSRSAARRSCSSTARRRSTGRRCRGRSPRCCRWPATSSASWSEQWCCGGPAAEMGYVDQAKKLRPAQPRQLAGHRHQAGAGARPARLHQLHRGLPEVLRRGVRHRGRPRHRGARRPAARGPADPVGARGPRDHVPRPVPAQQAQGHLAGAAGAAAGDPRAARSRTSTG